MLAVEVDGGNHIGGRHTSKQDYERRRLVIFEGWQTLAYMKEEVDAAPEEVAVDIVNFLDRLAYA